MQPRNLNKETKGQAHICIFQSVMLPISFKPLPRLELSIFKLITKTEASPVLKLIQSGRVILKKESKVYLSLKSEKAVLNSRKTQLRKAQYSQLAQNNKTKSRLLKQKETLSKKTRKNLSSK